MYYVMADLRDDFGNVFTGRVGRAFKKVESAIKYAKKFDKSNGTVYSYSKTIPIFSTNPKIKEILCKLDQSNSTKNL